MRKKILYGITLVIALTSYDVDAQLGTWKYQNPSPGPNGQNSLKVVNEKTVYVGGWGGYIAKTINGGTTWTDCTPPSNDGIGALEFINDTVGFASGELGKLYKTQNGGMSWTIIQLPDSTMYIGDMFFINQNVGFIGGMTFGSNGDSTYIAKTTDGGLTWVNFKNLKRFPRNIAKIQAFSSDTIMAFGFASEYDGTMFTCSHDGGKSWTNVFSLPNVGSSNYSQGTMHFLNNKEGYLFCTTPDTILKTMDGGLTWQSGGVLKLSKGTDFFPNTLHYFNSKEAVAFASYAADAIYTSDGGITWSNSVQSSNTSWIYSMKFAKKSLVGYANGGGGEVLKTIDGGKNWASVQSPLRTTQWGVDFLDNQNGFTCGNNGTIYKTTNGGISFMELKTGLKSRLTSIQKIKNTQIIYACGFEGKVLKSVNDGNDWTVLNTEVKNNLNSIYFVDKDLGIAVGDSGTIIKTINGGTTWASINASTKAKLNRVKIKDVNVYICSDTLEGGLGVFYKSHNLGDSFSKINISGYPESFFGLSFINDSTGHMCGTTGTIIKTTDYGKTWSQMLTNTTDEFFDVEFADESRGIAVGNFGLIYETSDGGETWDQNQGVITVALYDLSYTDINNAWAVGRTGGVAKYTNNFKPTSVKSVVSNFTNLQLFPNPSNGKINISTNEKINQLELINYSGTVIKSSSFNESQITYNIPENLSEGIYFIRLIGDQGSKTTKIVFTK
ncbi:MAG: T9SS C-terminal target domain-containing protein [Cytophagales bacterium]|nr:MAG: T9SS C-terminal target domain-containing protein [Cytophagales bacterium]